MSPDSTIISEEIQDAASVWLSRRDRGLSAAEQDTYLEWLYASPLHGRAIVQLERVWASLNKLEQWRPAHSAIPNPDLLLPRRSPWAKAGRAASLLAAAAAISMAIYVWLPSRSDPAVAHRAAIIHPGPERLVLADGSVIELNQGAKVEAHFTPGERRVQLVSGEAHFTVAHNADRPFFVDTGRVSVRAVGTAFSVALASTEVGVLVTEGKVQVIESVGSPLADGPSATDPGMSTSDSPTYLTAGQRMVVNLTSEAAPAVQDVTPAEIDRALSWQGMRLEFVDMPLGDVVAEFNRYNRRKLVVGDEATAAILVGGNFRADNVDTFVRLLDSGFGITAFPHGDEIVLRKVP
ncbi:FecR domain-containing protein [Opitutus sp. GAS368]|uniref:FecR family protein n=1 Tax=Opitutus sp. GAS368 TaxID=1882749 RepID=UPI00087D8D25|nr:FecR domain-containing protein [Opitutus sp. GAS368]SDS04819.1 FecR family protein [Opitutus sp. GAS368]